MGPLADAETPPQETSQADSQGSWTPFGDCNLTGGVHTVFGLPAPQGVDGAQNGLPRDSAPTSSSTGKHAWVTNFASAPSGGKNIFLLLGRHIHPIDFNWVNRLAYANAACVMAGSEIGSIRFAHYLLSQFSKMNVGLAR